MPDMRKMNGALQHTCFHEVPKQFRNMKSRQSTIGGRFLPSPRDTLHETFSPMSSTRPWGAYALMALSMALVGSYVALSKSLLLVFPVFLLAWLRFLMAAVAMLPWLRRPAGEPPLSAQEGRLLFWESFLGNFGFSICMLLGVQATSAVIAGVVMAGIPAAVGLLSSAFLKERMSMRSWFAIALAVGGIVILATQKQADGSTGGHAVDPPWWGYALLVGAVFCEASYVVIGKRLTARVSPQNISARINLWGLMLMTPMGVWQAVGYPFAKVGWADWLLLAFYAIAASVLTVWLWMRGLRRVPAHQAGVFTVCLPLASALIGVIGYGEPFGSTHLLAMALALLGLVVATWPTRVAPH